MSNKNIKLENTELENHSSLAQNPNPSNSFNKPNLLIKEILTLIKIKHASHKIVMH